MNQIFRIGDHGGKIGCIGPGGLPHALTVERVELGAASEQQRSQERDYGERLTSHDAITER